MLKKFLSIFVISSLVCLGIISCKKNSHPSSSSNEDLSPSQDVPPLSLNDGEGLSSSIKLLKEQFKKDKTNLVVSGLSVDFATCMLADGATGESLQQLESFFEKSKDEKTNELRGKLQTIKTSETLEISNAIWGNLFQEQYKTDMKNKLDVDAIALPGNTKAINDWIAEKTHGKIQHILEEEPTTPSSSYLANTIYFNGLWASKFDKNDTENRKFTTLSGSKIEIPTMLKYKSEIDYASDDDMESIRLKYKDGGTISIYLPREGKDFISFIQGLSKAKLLNMNYQTQVMHLALPKFEIQSDIDVKAILKSLNVTKIFDQTNKDFGVMMTQLPSYVEAIKQKAVITVDEEGTEAAAATGSALMSLGIDRTPRFLVNRPFLFYLSEGDFLGVYTGK